MSWAKLDDHFYCHRKVVKAGLAAVGVFVRSLSYSAAHTTDGRIDEDVAVRVLAEGDATLCDRLVTVGLWERDGEGFVIHDYLCFNPSSKQLEKVRKQTASRMRALRSRDAVTPAYPLRGCDGDVPGRDGRGSSSENPEGKSSRRGRGWRTVPQGETLTDTRRAMAVKLLVHGRQIDAEWAAFLDWEFRTPHVDVDKTWRRWCREAVRRLEERRPRPVVNERPGRERIAPNGGRAPLLGYDGAGAIVPGRKT